MTKYVTNAYEITDVYKEILLNAKDAKVKIEPSSDDHTKLVFFEKERAPYAFSVQDGKLTVNAAKSKWYNFWRIGIDRSQITLCVPTSMLDTIWVRSTVGRVEICSITCTGAIDIQTNTGKINLEGVACKSLVSKGNTASVSLSKITAKERISIKCNTGKVLLDDCSAPEIFVKTNTGRVCGRLPSNIVLTARTNTGKIEIPQVPVGETIGGRCEIKTNTGSIRFEAFAASSDPSHS